MSSQPIGTAGIPTADLLDCSEIAKAFGPTRAVASASLEVRRGEVHAILGENGSGKSTLVKILAGVQKQDSGTIRFTPRSDSRSPVHRPIATVFQEVLIASPRSVLENVWLGVDGVFRAAMPAREKRRRAGEILSQLCGRELPLDAPASSLSLSDQQACCIARALVRDPDLLILDEATSALDLETRDRLFTLLGRLRDEGMGTIFISHRMDELLSLADRVTVMRSGRTVAVVDRADATVEALVELMSDRERDQAEAIARVPRPDSTVLLRTESLVLAPGGQPIDIEIRAGEIIGLAGLEGHGQEALLKALWGAGAARGTVVRTREGHAGVVLRSPAHAARAGVAYVPRDRRKASIFASLSILENFAMTTLSADSLMGVARKGSRRRRFEQYRDALVIRHGHPDDAITTLSGGNQQKVILARWLATEPQVLLLNDPTRGIDLGAKADIYALLGRMVESGAAVVMLSSELEEQLTLMDRVIVMREHAVFATFEGDQITREALVAAFFGVREEAA